MNKSTKIIKVYQNSTQMEQPIFHIWRLSWYLHVLEKLGLFAASFWGLCSQCSFYSGDRSISQFHYNYNCCFILLNSDFYLHNLSKVDVCLKKKSAITKLRLLKMCAYNEYKYIFVNTKEHCFQYFDFIIEISVTRVIWAA